MKNITKVLINDLGGKSFVFKDFTDMYAEERYGQPFVSDGIMFCLCTQGKLKIQIDYKEYDIPANHLFVVLPKHVFAVLSRSADLKMEILFTSMDYIRHLPIVPDFDVLKQTNAAPWLAITDEQTRQLTKLYSVLETYNTDTIRTKQIRIGLTLSLILIIISLFENSKPGTGDAPASRAENLTRLFFDLLLQHGTRERSVQFYADKLFITPKYLSMTVKSVTGHSVQEWLNEAVIVQAKRYIKTTDFTIQQIADELHFTTSSSFVRFFKQQTGTTPMAYRKE